MAEAVKVYQRVVVYVKEDLLPVFLFVVDPVLKYKEQV